MTFLFRVYCLTLYYVFGHQAFSLWIPKTDGYDL